MTTPDILLQIAADRTQRIRREGPAQGLNLPRQRKMPQVSFQRPPGGESGILIAEVKRRSPSKGEIAHIPEPAELAGRYKDAGFRRVSVLTEEARFGGTLADLIAVKSAHPDLAILRKDFLLSVEDVDVSHLAGADAVLLIAALLEAPLLEEMYRRAGELGLACLVEVHSSVDVDKVRPLAPPLVGINSRDLRSFRVEPLIPLETRSFIDWPCDVVYESGISEIEDVQFIRGSNFDGFLVGEAVARKPGLAKELILSWIHGEEAARRRYSPWERLYRRHRQGVPLVKICGITKPQDAQAAVNAQADMIGFVMAESPRRTRPEVIRECRDLPVLKAAVVVLGPQEPPPAQVIQLLDEGALDFLQFHGDESRETVQAWPSYKAVNLRLREDAELLDRSGSPAVLVDAFSPDSRGGTGKRLDYELLAAASHRRRLWIAGGLTPENVSSVVKEWNPGLVDTSSGVEASPGVKDYDKLRRFVHAARRNDNEG